MSKIKKLIALTLALAMVLSVSAFAGSYKADTYVDAAAIDADCKSAIELLYALEIMKGDDKGQFRPTDGITRAEMAKMIYVILNYGDDDKAVTYKGGKFFTDVEAGYWAEGYINYCASTKLIAGRGDGTFDPTANVTTAEAAKMLLTAIGYSAEHRGYTGANWDKNVLADAAILGLLDGYKSNVNLVAPRQWVAVMVANALDCYTYGTMAPSFSGLLVSGTNVNNGVVEYVFDTMGEKYYGYKAYTGYLVAANGYAIDAYTDGLTNKSGYAVLQYTDGDGNTAYKSFKTSVTIDDLGQQFKVIAVGSSVLSIRNTGKSVVAEDEVKDVTYELTYATSSNNYKNRYEFTVGDMTAKIDTDTNKAKALDVKYGNKTYTVEDADTLKASIVFGKDRNDVVRAIDKNGDGDFDYIIYTPVNYGRVEKVATSQKYGEYVKIVGIDNKTYLPFAESGTNLYLKDTIICEDELEKDNFVKFSWNIDEGKYDVEVLPVIEAVEFEARKASKNLYTFDTESYTLAANAFVGMEAYLEGTNVLEEDFDIVVDGDLLVYAALTDDNYADIDEVNEHLALLIKHNVGNLDRENVEQVKLMTIDGNIEWYWYDATKAAKTDNDLVSFDALENDTLYIYYVDEDGWVTLEAIEEKQAGEGNLKTKLVDTFEVFAKGDEADERGDLDNTGTRTLYELSEEKDYRVAGTNKFFAKVDGEYMVITMDDLAEGLYENVEAQVMIKDGTYYDTILGGYVDIDEAVVSGIGYLYIVDADVKEIDDETKLISVMFPGADEAVEIEVAITNTRLVNEWVYSYTQSDDVYTLSYMSGWTKLVEEDGELWNEAGKNVELDHDIYVLTYTTNYRIVNDKTTEERTEVKTEYVDADAILAAFADMDEATYDYEFEYLTDENADEVTIFYMQVTRDMIENQTGEIEIEY